MQLLTRERAAWRVVRAATSERDFSIIAASPGRRRLVEFLNRPPVRQPAPPTASNVVDS